MKIHRRAAGPSRLSYLIYVGTCLTLFFLLGFMRRHEFPPPQAGRSLPPGAKTAVPEPAAAPHESIEIIQAGQTLSDLLSARGFSAAEIHDLRAEVKPVYDLARIRAGKEFRFYSDPGGEPHHMEYDIDGETYLHIDLASGAVRAEIRDIPFNTSIHRVRGIIRDNLIHAVHEIRESDQLAIQLEELFAWDIDFYADMRPDDSFEILFEKKHLRGEFTGYGNILAAQFTNQGKTFQAFRYTHPENGEVDYFDYEGNSLRKEFLKSPIGSARITSRFSHSRLHPVRKVYRPHYGVDYAAPVGTHVHATAAGTVTFTGWNGGAGRMIRIRHKNNYETMYLHLRRFAPGIRQGSKVQSGQYIAQVGSSGESTGPHLDYRIRYRGKYINPLAHRFKPVKPLAKEFIPDFQSIARRYRTALVIPSGVTCRLPRPGM